MKSTRIKIIVIASIVLLTFKNTQAQTLATINQPGIALNPTDAFTFMNNSVGFYGLGWYREMENMPPIGYLSGYSGLKFFTAGSPRMVLNEPGNLGIGTLNPISRLNIVGGDESITLGDYSASLNQKGIYFPGFRDVVPNYFGASIEAVPEWLCCSFPGPGGYPGIKNMGFNFNIHGNPDLADSKITAMSINAMGNVGIGTISPKERLSVNGNIRAKEIKVEAENWPDYVFYKDYDLLSLPELQSYIKENGHLPEMPSAGNVEQEGIELGEMNKKLLKKVEELTLYLLAKDHELEAQNQKINSLEKGQQELKDMLKQLLKK
ncbi:hypothetical protein G6M26_06405 [Agrobacterium tumefaciens]|nr:hypothetical protein [Agrobacterium tumefaciens]NTE18149.1 hypothetical protein [Agrobacterium tumefaciens]